MAPQQLSHTDIPREDVLIYVELSTTGGMLGLAGQTAAGSLAMAALRHNGH